MIPFSCRQARGVDTVLVKEQCDKTSILLLSVHFSYPSVILEEATSKTGLIRAGRMLVFHCVETKVDINPGF